MAARCRRARRRETGLPGVLGLAAVGRAIDDGPEVASIALEALGAVVLVLSRNSHNTQYAGIGGSVFWGGFITLLGGGAIGVAVLARSVIARADFEWFGPTS